jgi:hypothetical protein
LRSIKPPKVILNNNNPRSLKLNNGLFDNIFLNMIFGYGDFEKIQIALQ